jgi:hypothetical protein
MENKKQDIEIINTLMSKLGVTVQDLNVPEKKKFVTNDNVTVYEGDVVYWVKKSFDGTWELNPPHIELDKCHVNEQITDGYPYKIFSTLQAAQAFIDRENTPKFSFTTKDGVTVTDGEQMIFGCDDIGKINWFSKHCVDDKKYTWFSTEAARNTYIAENKPMYSLSDVRKTLIDQIPLMSQKRESIIEILQNLKK